MIAGVCSGIAKYLDIDPSLFASFGLQRFSYSEQAFFLHHLLDYYPRRASGVIIEYKRDTDLNFLPLSFLFFFIFSSGKSNS
ncbi:MAG: PspC domain-containing protein [Streptococcus sp.]